MESVIFEPIKQTIATLNVEDIPEERKGILDPLATYIHGKVVKNEPIALNFICTHNSRRSHLSQIWAQTLAYHVGLDNISCYSGGTEATALFPMVATTMKKLGFEIAVLSENQNPIYSIKFAANVQPIIGFSKTFDDPFNPKTDFGAVMTCSSADEGCPFVSGSDGRFPITFEDPKAFDQTPQQAEKYRERSIQIATELLYVMQKAATLGTVN